MSHFWTLTYYMYDSYVEQENAKGRALNSIFEELKAKGFSGSHITIGSCSIKPIVP